MKTKEVSTDIVKFDDVALFEVVDSGLMEVVTSEPLLEQVGGGFVDGACANVNGACNNNAICGSEVNTLCAEAVNGACVNQDCYNNGG